MMAVNTITSSRPPQPPPGIRFFTCSANRSRRFHQILVLVLTFAAYASFHASRKPPSIVKAVLTMPVNETLSTNAAPVSAPDRGPYGSGENGTGWAPFDGPDGTQRLGQLDFFFLLFYAIGMYGAGHFGDSIDLRIFLTIGMMGSGFFVIVFGLGYFLDWHSFAAFVVIQVLCGLFQSIGWPCVVAVVGNWSDRAGRGLMMGAWNSHTSVGNIVGSVVASSALGSGWGWSFLWPGFIIMVVAAFVFLFLVVHPENMGFEISGNDAEENVEAKSLVESEKTEGAEGDGDTIESENEIETENHNRGSVAIGFLAAWQLPNVASFAFCLFFSKLVAYTFLYWLPFYIRHAGVAGELVDHKRAGMLSIIFDAGGVLGGISAGFISDWIEARGVTSVLFFMLSIPTLILYRLFGSISMYLNIPLMFASGLLVNGPYSLITTAVAADLGTQPTIRGNSRALATVTAIIDGTGSVGAALGPLLAGHISTGGWNSVFGMLIFSILFAGCLLIDVVRNEIGEKVNQGRWLRLSRFSR